MTSTHEPSAKLLSLFRQSGFEDELEERLFAQRQERRKQLADELRALPERDKVLGPLEKDVALLGDALRTAELKLAAAERAYHSALTRSVVTATSLEGQKTALLRELETTAPEFLRTHWERLELMRTNLRHAARPTHEGWAPRPYGGERYFEIWNCDAVLAARERVEKRQEELRQLMRNTDLPLAELRRRADGILRAAEQVAEPLLKDCYADVYRRERDRLFGVAAQKSA